MKSDLIAVHYRRRWQELAEQGWLLSDEDRIMGDVPRREAKGEHPTVAEAERLGQAYLEEQ